MLLVCHYYIISTLLVSHYYETGTNPALPVRCNTSIERVDMPRPNSKPTPKIPNNYGINAQNYNRGGNIAIAGHGTLALKILPLKTAAQ